MRWKHIMGNEKHFSIHPLTYDAKVTKLTWSKVIYHAHPISEILIVDTVVSSQSVSFKSLRQALSLVQSHTLSKLPLEVRVTMWPGDLTLGDMGPKFSHIVLKDRRRAMPNVKAFRTTNFPLFRKTVWWGEADDSSISARVKFLYETLSLHGLQHGIPQYKLRHFLLIRHCAWGARPFSFLLSSVDANKSLNSR